MFVITHHVAWGNAVDAGKLNPLNRQRLAEMNHTGFRGVVLCRLLACRTGDTVADTYRRL